MMDKQERLRERYEDALFAIMMDELASSLGKEAEEENERLKNDPDAAVPEQIDKRCLKTIRGHYRKAAVRHAGRVTLKTLACFAMTLGVASALFIGAFAISENVRLSTMNLIVETFGESTDFFFAPVPDNGIPQIKTGWVPKDYAQNDEGFNDLYSWFILRGPEGQFVQGSYHIGDGQITSVDTEDATVSNIQVQNTHAMLVVKGDSIQIVWERAECVGLIVISSEGASLDDVLKIAENVHFN